MRTPAERAMWRILREAFPETRFRRQVPLRHFIADFASHRARLVIECDGGQHGEDADAERTQLIEAEGYRLLRFWNNDVLGNAEGVHAAIAAALLEAHPPPSLPHQGGGVVRDALPPLDGEGRGGVTLAQCAADAVVGADPAHILLPLASLGGHPHPASPIEGEE